MREEDDENSLSPNMRLPAIKLQTQSDFQQKEGKRSKLETVEDSDAGV